MSDLDRKASDWGDKMVKGIVFFAILGIIVLIVAVTSIGKIMGDITSGIEPASKSAVHKTK
jgi:hypothetical protein